MPGLYRDLLPDPVLEADLQMLHTMGFLHAAGRVEGGVIEHCTDAVSCVVLTEVRAYERTADFLIVPSRCLSSKSSSSVR